MFARIFSKSEKPSTLDKELADAYTALGIRKPGKPIKAGFAKATLIDLLMRHADLLMQEGNETQADNLYALATALSGKDVSSTHVSDDLNTKQKRADSLMRRGLFVPAIKLFEDIVAQNPKKAKAHKCLSALYHHAGDKERAHDVMADHYFQFPENRLSKAQVNKSAPILCLYGFDKTQFKVSYNEHKGYRFFRSGGHFMLRYLLNENAYNMHGYTIANNNINQTAPTVDYKLILNTIADADTEYNSLKSLEKYLSTRPKTSIINHPTKVLETTRDGNYQRLNTLTGFRFPQTERLQTDNLDPKALAATIEEKGYNYPFIIRETGTHTASTTALIETHEALVKYLAGVSRSSVYLIEFVANASEEGHYTKIRFFSIDGVLYPVVHHIDQVWNVHGDNRKTFMAGYEWMVKREEQFLGNPASIIGEDIYKRLQQLPALIGLEFFGFDCTILEDGTVLIFELNPAMRHSFTHAKNFPYMEPHMQAISDAFDAMVKKRLIE